MVIFLHVDNDAMTTLVLKKRRRAGCRRLSVSIGLMMGTPRERQRSIAILCRVWIEDKHRPASASTTFQTTWNTCLLQPRVHSSCMCYLPVFPQLKYAPQLVSRFARAGVKSLPTSALQFRSSSMPERGRRSTKVIRRMGRRMNNFKRISTYTLKFLSRKPACIGVGPKTQTLLVHNSQDCVMS